MPSEEGAAPAGRRERPLTIAIAAMGGQGGGVLADWIVDLAEDAGWIAQSTSVPGVAQRTGATVYYLELFPGDGRTPVMALMPVPGDVDVVIAGELVEAARSIVRGLVSPDRTTLIASRHRDYALAEKMALGEGRVDEGYILERARAAAARLVCFDMDAVTAETGSVISSVLFGALAGAGVLPFGRDGFEAAIRRAGVAVDSNLAGFAAGYARAQAAPEAVAEHETPPAGERPAAVADAQLARLLERVHERFPPAMHELLRAGLRRMVDYQDVRYAADYLARCESVLVVDNDHGGTARDHHLTLETVRHLALWMSYEDTFRVADVKTRAARFARVRSEVRAGDDEPVYITEFMHPRVQEVCDSMPAWLGRFVLGMPPLRALVAVLCRPRRVRTATVSGFLLLYSLAALRRVRRGTYRYRLEQGRIEAWLHLVRKLAAQDYALACEVARCQRLIKGYGETHERGLRSFQAIMAAVERLRGRPEAAATVRELSEAALADEHGAALDAALERHGLPRAA